MTAPRITLAVDGRGGAARVADREAHLLPFQVVANLPGTAGRPGIDAPSANHGEHAGVAQLEVSRSRKQQGGVTLRVLKQQGAQQLPQQIEILPRGRLLLTAIGGAGEQGRKGGDGENGTIGETGQHASREVDATQGGPGGAGGDAGMGSDGANGGNGGHLQIIVDEEDLDLLYGIDCDVSGGHGGEAGEHGKPGVAGEGGRGGNSLVWEDVVNHKYKCTSACVGGSADVSLLRNQRDATMDMFRRLQEETARRSTMNRIIARSVATTNHSQLGLPAVQGACKCHGGAGHCPGCLATPIYQTSSRSAGLPGPCGVMGNLPHIQLMKGESGRSGHLSFVVKMKHGQGLEGSSKYSLELAGFDVEDGNADGIFEPGEDIFIRRIQVNNSGEIVSPMRLIECTLSMLNNDVIASDQDIPAYLPTSIPPRSSRISSSEIAARLVSSEITINSRPPYQADKTINLQAIMPWTMLPVKEFELSKSILVEYPVEIREIVVPQTIMTGRESSMIWKIFNKSTRPFGKSPNYERIAQVVVRVNGDFAQVQGSDGSWANQVILTAPTIQPSASIEMTNSVRVNGTLLEPSEFDVRIQLFISRPYQTECHDGLDNNELQMIETHSMKVQVTPGYAFSPSDDVLIVTHSGTRVQEIEALLDLFRSTLSLNVQILNTSIQGSLMVHRDDSLEHIECILSKYSGKAVVLLANSPSLLQTEHASVISMCDPVSLLSISEEHTSCLFFEFSNSATERSTLDGLFRPLERTVTDVMYKLPKQARYETPEDLIRSLSESGVRCDRYCLVAIRKSKLRSQDANIAQAAKNLSAALQSQMPHYHFTIGKVPQLAGGKIDGHLLVHLGVRRIARIRASQAGTMKPVEKSLSFSQVNLLDMERRPTRIRRRQTSLSTYDKFILISALPAAKRMEILDQKERAVAEQLASLIELSLEQQLDTEIQLFVDSVSNIKLKGVLRDRFLRDCLPTTSCLIDHVAGRESVSNGMRRVLAYCFASCRPQSRRASISETINPRAQARQIISTMLESGVGTRKQSASEASQQRKERRVSSILAERINEVTGQSADFQQNSSYGPSQSLRVNDILTAEEWNAAAQRTIDTENKVVESYHTFLREQERLQPTKGFDGVFGRMEGTRPRMPEMG